MAYSSDDFGESTQSREADRIAERSPRAYLLVLEGTTSSVFYLPPAGEVLIGRSEQCQIRLRDASTSRRHARVQVAEGGVTLEDLGSQNGTFVNSQRLEAPRPLSSGDVISICYATLVFHQGQRMAPVCELVGLTALRRRLDDEINRALRYRRAVTLAALRFAPPVRRDELSRRSAELLRRLDVAAWDESDLLLVVLPESDLAQARTAVDRLRSALKQAGKGMSAGIASCPDDGCDGDALLAGARAAVERASSGHTLAASEATSRLDVGDRSIIVAEQAMVHLYDLLRRLAATDVPVLLHGETGVGKEIAARALHEWSPRRQKKLVAINCAALPENLVENELFGHDAGAYTGASAARAGLFERADGGTVLLDEVGELSLGTQAKLLRVLESKRLTRLGGTVERAVDFRLVAATNRALATEVANGRFRQDLYFRIGATTVAIPPLRDRHREIPLFARAFLDEARARAGRSPMQIDPSAMELLTHYAWPGNVRELHNVMESVAAVQGGEIVAPDMLPQTLRQTALPEAAPIHENTDPLPLPHFRPLSEEIEQLERQRIAEALEAAGGVQTRAAELISMPVRTFIAKMNAYGLAPPKRRRKATDP